MPSFRHRRILRLQLPKSCRSPTLQLLSLLDLHWQAPHVQAVTKIVPCHSKLTSQPALASPFPSCFCRNPRAGGSGSTSLWLNGEKKWVLFFKKWVLGRQKWGSRDQIIIVEAITNMFIFSPPNPGHTLPRGESGAFLILLILTAFCQWSYSPGSWRSPTVSAFSIRAQRHLWPFQSVSSHPG